MNNETSITDEDLKGLEKKDTDLSVNINMQQLKYVTGLKKAFSMKEFVIRKNFMG